jgi:hypothetical protein
MDETKKKELMKQVREILLKGLMIRYLKIYNRVFDMELKEKFNSLFHSVNNRYLYLCKIIDTDPFIVESDIAHYSNVLNEFNKQYEVLTESDGVETVIKQSRFKKYKQRPYAKPYEYHYLSAFSSMNSKLDRYTYMTIYLHHC